MCHISATGAPQHEMEQGLIKVRGGERVASLQKVLKSPNPRVESGGTHGSGTGHHAALGGSGARLAAWLM